MSYKLLPSAEEQRGQSLKDRVNGRDGEDGRSFRSDGVGIKLPRRGGKC